ncbi:MAG: L,D-transpeptidase family protein [Candidatus Hydrogenedentota bacterium]
MKGTHHSEDTTAERRCSTRRATNKKAVFVARDPRALLHRGEVTDISLAGLGIRTHTPEPAGTRIEIELQRAGERGSGILTRGRVVRVEALGQGRYTMGVALRVPGPAITPADLPDGAVQETMRQAVDSVAQQVRTQAPEAPSPIAVIEELRDSPARPVHVQPAGGAKRKKYRRRALAALVLIALLALLLHGAVRMPPLLQAEHKAGVTTGPGVYAVFQGYADPAPKADTPARSTPPTLPDTAVTASPDQQTISPLATPADLLSRAQDELAQADPAAALAIFARVADHTGASPRERFLAHFGQAQAAQALGDIAAARTHSARSLTTADAAARPWRRAARAFDEALAMADAGALRAATMRESMGLRMGRGGRAPTAAGESMTEAPLWVEVRKADYVLVVHVDGEPVRAFPVGLGRGGSTPTGTFRIANKITDPDWYNRGKTVKTGDPRNPLGSRWMGLANDNGPTVYGIHPTSESASIGGNESRGCVRMRPADAETLFRLCAKGTPVCIVP